MKVEKQKKLKIIYLLSRQMFGLYRGGLSTEGPLSLCERKDVWIDVFEVKQQGYTLLCLTPNHVLILIPPAVPRAPNVSRSVWMGKVRQFLFLSTLWF